MLFRSYLFFPHINTEIYTSSSSKLLGLSFLENVRWDLIVGSSLFNTITLKNCLVGSAFSGSNLSWNDSTFENVIFNSDDTTFSVQSSNIKNSTLTITNTNNNIISSNIYNSIISMDFGTNTIVSSSINGSTIAIQISSTLNGSTVLQGSNMFIDATSLDNCYFGINTVANFQNVVYAGKKIDGRFSDFDVPGILKNVPTAKTIDVSNFDYAGIIKCQDGTGIGDVHKVVTTNDNLDIELWYNGYVIDVKIGRAHV